MFKARSAVTALLLSFACVAEAQAASPPPEAFGVTPRMANVALSPSGALIAWAEPIKEVPHVVVFDLAKKQNVRTVPVTGKLKIRDVVWADDRTLIINISLPHVYPGSKVPTEVFRYVAIDVLGDGPMRNLLMEHGADKDYVSGASIESLASDKPGTIVMSTMHYMATARREEMDTRLRNATRDSGWTMSLFDVDLSTGKGKIRESGGVFTNGWVVDAKGNAVARSEWEASRNRFRVTARSASGGWSEIFKRDDGGTFELIGPSPDGTAVLAIGSLDDDRSKLWAIALDGSGAKVLIEDPKLDVQGYGVDPYTRQPVYVTLGGLESARRWIDPKSEARFNALAKSFPGKEVVVFGRSQDGNRALIDVSDPSSPPVYYLVDFKARTADIVGEAYPQLLEAKLGRVENLTYAARDGYSIPAYLTLPPDSDGKNLPTVILPHGGPYSRDQAGFDWLAQFLATRGYAVLQPQFRGSTGFGDAHELAGRREWGGLMQNDVSDGVKALVDRGVTDPARVCIVGASYGGYAALAGATLTPDLYRCAASINGVSDLPSMIGFIRREYGTDSNAINYMYRDLGAVGDEKLGARSPVNLVARTRAPVLLMHGADDSVVPIYQSEAMERSMKQYGKPVTFVRMPGEDHWLSRSETRVQVLQELEKFLARNLNAS